MKLMITGSIAYDYLMSFNGKFSDHFLPDKLDSISVSFLVDSLKKQKGGCAANIAYSLALLNERPLLVGTVGQDFPEYKEHLDNAGVDTTGVMQYDNDMTASFFGNADQDGNQIASFCPGAMKYSSQIDLTALGADENSMVIVSPNDPSAMMKYVQTCQDHKIPYIFDPGQQMVILNKEQLIQGATGAKVFIVNDYEIGLFTKATGIEEDAILELAETVIITRGVEGSDILTREGTVKIPIAAPEQVLDPTGVGDAFRSGLLKGMKHELSWETTGRMGSLAASYSLENEGPQKHSYGIDEFVNRYIQTFGKNDEIESLR